MGLKVTIEHLVQTLELRHDEHCHHCGTIDRAYESADAAQTLMAAMRPAMRELTQVQLHPSLLKKDETGDEDEAQSLAESTINLFGSFQLSIQGDPADPERSLHAFYLDGTLHVKRLTDPFPKGMTTTGASAIASQTGALATAHGMDHAEGFADLVAERAREMELEADCGLHAAAPEEINQYLGNTGPHHPGSSHPGRRGERTHRGPHTGRTAHGPKTGPVSASHAGATEERDGRGPGGQPPPGDGRPHGPAPLHRPGGPEPET